MSLTPSKWDHLQKTVDKDHELQRVLVVLSGVGSGFGITEAEIIERTGLENQRAQKCLWRLQCAGVVELQFSQIGTAGPYSYFFRLVPEIKVKVIFVVPEQED